MPVRVTLKPRGPSVLVNYTFIGEAQQEQACEKDIVIDNLVAVSAKVKNLNNGQYKFYIKDMKMIHTEEKIVLKVSCENPSFNEKWECREDWSYWRNVGVINDRITHHTCIYNVEINMSVRKIEKPELCAKMYLDADFTDFSLSAANGSVAVHRIIMASHSEVFKAMLNGEWKETVEGRIEVTGTTRECLEHLKDYMYLDILPDEGLGPLLLLALRYMIGNLKTRCICKLTDSVTSENLYELLNFACLNNIPELKYEILHLTPSKIVEKAFTSKKNSKTGVLPNSDAKNTKPLCLAIKKKTIKKNSVGCKGNFN